MTLLNGAINEAVLGVLCYALPCLSEDSCHFPGGDSRTNGQAIRPIQKVIELEENELLADQHF